MRWTLWEIRTRRRIKGSNESVGLDAKEKEREELYSRPSFILTTIKAMAGAYGCVIFRVYGYDDPIWWSLSCQWSFEDDMFRFCGQYRGAPVFISLCLSLFFSLLVWCTSFVILIVLEASIRCGLSSHVQTREIYRMGLKLKSRKNRWRDVRQQLLMISCWWQRKRRRRKNEKEKMNLKKKK